MGKIIPRIIRCQKKEKSMHRFSEWGREGRSNPRHEALVGKHALVAFRTTHIDRAGETGVQVLRYGEIVAEDGPDWVVIDAEEGEHLRCPAARLHRAPSRGSFLGPRGEAVKPDYVAAEELIRDFHSAKHPLILRWLGRTAALALCRAVASQGATPKF
jgi:hypothetical protein